MSWPSAPSQDHSMAVHSSHLEGSSAGPGGGRAGRPPWAPGSKGPHSGIPYAALEYVFGVWWCDSDDEYKIQRRISILQHDLLIGEGLILLTICKCHIMGIIFNLFNFGVLKEHHREGS
jgi:hypothetical protein